MNLPYTSHSELIKRRRRFQTFAKVVLWTVALIVILAVIGGGAFGADGTKPDSTGTGLWIVIAIGVFALMAVIASSKSFRHHWMNNPLDDTRDWIVSRERKPSLYVKPETAYSDVPGTAAADLTLASARACHDSQFASGDIVPDNFYVQPLGKPFNPEDYLNKTPAATETGRGIDGVCTYCHAPACETHRSGCFYIRPANLIERKPRPCRADDIPEAHDLLSSHVNEIDTILADPAHFDDTCVDAYAEAIKAEMRVAREQKGRHGWWDSEKFTDAQLELALRLVMRKGDVVSIGAYAMMLHHRGITFLR